ncbi:carbohydrate ABC transporter permease [Alicyclobacillus macrosporangiidus]|uniref:carbohydrate ABC transporter permease n=1 Tax=Alicyclobacillus macrosporangiidus TaxID=392015 RepID=UPI000497131A|nr:sugar ABC transporter permease [Alicyclobacillus macrosporangiidus]
MQTAVSNTTIPMPPRRRTKEVMAFLQASPFLLPALLLFTVFFFYPIVKVVYLSLYLTNSKGVAKHFVGMQQYVELFTSPDFIQSLRVTLEFVLLTVIPGVFIALLLALLLEKQIRGLSVFQTIIFSPISMSVAAVSTIGLMAFNPSVSLLNWILSKLFGIPNINWLNGSWTALLAISIVTIWMNLGFSTIVLLGALRNVSQELYDSARVDGANYLQRLCYITIPSISPTLFFVFVVSMIGSFQTFGQVNILTQGGPAGSTNLVVYSIYRNAFFNFQYGLASAQAVVLFIIVLVLTLLQFLVVERRVHYS